MIHLVWYFRFLILQNMHNIISVNMYRYVFHVLGVATLAVYYYILLSKLQTTSGKYYAFWGTVQNYSNMCYFYSICLVAMQQHLGIS